MSTNKPFSISKSGFKMFVRVLYRLGSFGGHDGPRRKADGTISKRTIAFSDAGESTDLDGFCTALAVYDSELAAKARAFVEAGDALCDHIDSKVSG